MTFHQLKTVIDRVLLENGGDDPSASVDGGVLFSIMEEVAEACQREGMEKLDTRQKEELADCLSLAKRSLAGYGRTTENLVAITRAGFEKLDQGEMDQLAALRNGIVAELERAEREVLQFQGELERLESSSRWDLLTKVYNQQALELELALILQRATHRKPELNLLVLTLTNLESLPGDAGEKVLFYVASQLKRNVRAENGIYRHGTNKFVVVANRTDEATARTTLERIIDQLKNKSLVYQEEKIVLELEGRLLVHREGDSPESMLAGVEG